MEVDGPVVLIAQNEPGGEAGLGTVVDVEAPVFEGTARIDELHPVEREVEVLVRDRVCSPTSASTPSLRRPRR